MALSHNSKLSDSEPSWASVDKTKLPRSAFADQGDEGKKSTWKFPHHFVEGGSVDPETGVYSSGTMYLHKGGLNAAWAAAQGARSGETADESIISHLNKHRKDIGLEKSGDQIMNWLKNIDVHFISLVDKGANKKTIIYKSESPAQDENLTRDFDLVKFDEEKGIAYGIVYSPDEEDTQGDAATAAEIEKAAYSFMKNLRLRNVDEQHNQAPDENFVCESWIVRDGDPLFKNEKVGSWAVGVKIVKQETKEKIKSGELSGFSMGGFAMREAVTKSLWQRIKTALEKSFTGNIAEAQTRRATYDLIDAFAGAVQEVFSDEYTGDRKSGLLSTVDEMRKWIDENFAGMGVSMAKEGRVVSAKNERILRNALHAINGILKLNQKIIKEDESDMEKSEIQTMIDEAIKKSTEDLKKVLDETAAKVNGFQTLIDQVKKSADKATAALQKATDPPGSAQAGGQEVVAAEFEKGKDGKPKSFIFS